MNYDSNNIFAKILRGEASCISVYEDEHTLAFMDIMPQMEGHLLVIPKEPAVTLYDLTDQAAQACFRTIKRVGKALEKAMDFEGTTVFQHNGAKVGQSVPHAHFHIIPGPLFKAGALKGHAAELADPQQLEALAAKIKAHIHCD